MNCPCICDCPREAQVYQLCSVCAMARRTYSNFHRHPDYDEPFKYDWDAFPEMKPQLDATR